MLRRASAPEVTDGTKTRSSEHRRGSDGHRVRSPRRRP